MEYADMDGNRRALCNAVYNQFQPRVGFAYQVQPRLIVRGGYGITSYLEGTGANHRLTQNPPFHTDFEPRVQNLTAPNKVCSVGVYYQAANGFPTTTEQATTLYVWHKDLKPVVTQEFSLTTEYELTSTSSFQVGYVGIIGHHLNDPYWGNQLTSPGATAAYASVVGQNGVIKITQTESNSSYNALLAVFRQRLRVGLELTADYTYAKSLTDDIGFDGVSNIGSGQYCQQNAYDIHSERGPAGFEVRQALSVTGTYDLPFGRGKTFGTN